MKFNTRFLTATLGGLLLAAVPSFATTVEYTTTGSFSTGTTFTNEATLSSGDGVTLTFFDVPNALTGGADNTPATDSLGYFQLSGTGSLDVPAGETFTLVIDQSNPAGTGSISNSSITGTISEASGSVPNGTVGSGDLILTFSQTSIDVAGVTYTLLDLGQDGLASNQLGIGTTSTIVEAAITGTPEPSSYLLTGMGLLGLVAGLVRRKRQNA